MDVATKIRSGARWLSAARIASQIYSWAITVFVMRLLSPGDYGLIAMAMVFVSFVEVFEDLGFRVKLIQLAEYTREYARSVYGLVVLTNLAISAALLGGAPFASAFFGEAQVAPIMMVLAVLPILSALGSIPEATMMRALDFPKIAMIDTLRAFVSSTVTIALAWFGFGVWSLVIGNIAAAAVRTAGLILASPFGATPSFKFAGLGETFRFGGLVLLQRIVGQVQNGADTVLIGRFLDAQMLGLYSAGAQLATLPLQKVGAMLNTLSFTGLSRVTHDMEVFRHYLRRSMKIVSLLLFPCFFGIASISAEFVPLVMGPGWKGMEVIVAIFAFAAPPRALSNILLEALNSLGHPEANLKCKLVNAALFVAAVFAGLPWGIQGVALATVIASYLAFFYHYYIARPFVGLLWVDAAMATWPAGVASSVMFVTVVGLRPFLPLDMPSLAGLVASTVLGAIVYGGMILATDRDGVQLVRKAVLGG